VTSAFTPKPFRSQPVMYLEPAVHIFCLWDSRYVIFTVSLAFDLCLSHPWRFCLTLDRGSSNLPSPVWVAVTAQQRSRLSCSYRCLSPLVAEQHWGLALKPFLDPRKLSGVAQNASEPVKLPNQFRYREWSSWLGHWIHSNGCMYKLYRSPTDYWSLCSMTGSSMPRTQTPGC